MKTKTIIIALLMVLITGNCFAQNKLFDKFSEMEGVTSVFISKLNVLIFPDGFDQFVCEHFRGNIKNLGLWILL